MVSAFLKFAQRHWVGRLRMRKQHFLYYREGCFNTLIIIPCKLHQQPSWIHIWTISCSCPNFRRRFQSTDWSFLVSFVLFLFLPTCFPTHTAFHNPHRKFSTWEISASRIPAPLCAPAWSVLGRWPNSAERTMCVMTKFGRLLEGTEMLLAHISPFCFLARYDLSKYFTSQDCN